MKILIYTSFLLCCQQAYSQSEVDCSRDAGFNNKQELSEFTNSLKTADSFKTLSPLISYPLRVNTGSNKHFMIKNENELKVRFKEAFSDEILKSIHNQDPKTTFCNYQGLAIGNGAVWINNKNGKTGIYVINTSAK